jgi:hypothetical protein
VGPRCSFCGTTDGPFLDVEAGLRLLMCPSCQAAQAADQHAVAMGEVAPQEPVLSERPAAPGELCTCGRQAIVVYLGSVFGPTGYCGIPDGGDTTGPCPFCRGPRH